MKKLHKIVKKKYKDFDITPQHLGQVIRNNNITKKRIRHKHYSKDMENPHILKKVKAFYKLVNIYLIKLFLLMKHLYNQ